MKIRDLLVQRLAQLAVVAVEVPGFGPVQVKRLKAGEMIAASKTPGESGLALVQAAVVDEEGRPVFGDLQQVRDLDWALVSGLIDACNGANRLQVDAAAKN